MVAKVSGGTRNPIISFNKYELIPMIVCFACEITGRLASTHHFVVGNLRVMIQGRSYVLTLVIGSELIL